jgi:hypothetical protein
MNFMPTIRNLSMSFILVTILVLVSFAKEAGQAQTSQKNSEELLLEIMDLHSELVTNETFLAQAKILGAYLEAAQSQNEVKKTKIYGKVLDIMAKIKNSTVRVPSSPIEEESSAGQKIFEGEQAGESVFEPGVSLLEIFKSDSMDAIPALPVIRTYWRSDLAYSGAFLVPERINEIGLGKPCVAKFSFYLRVQEAGKYGFTVEHGNLIAGRLRISGVTVVEARVGNWEKVAQGVCNLEKGFHRVEFWLASDASPLDYGHSGFKVRVLLPGAFDSVLLTSNMMLLKKE